MQSMTIMLAFAFVTIAAGLDDIQLNLDQQGQLLNVFTELQSVDQETKATFAKVDAVPPTEPPPTVAPLGMLETAASVAAQPEVYPVQAKRPQTMSEAFQAFDALTSTKSLGLSSLSAANHYGDQVVQQVNMVPPQPKIRRGPLESLLMDDDAPEQQEQIQQPQAPQQKTVNFDFQQLLGGKPMGVAPRAVSSVSRQQEFLPPVMLQQKAGQDEQNDVPATGLWKEKGGNWPKFAGDVFDAYQRGLRSHHARAVQDAFLEIPSDKPKQGKTSDGKDVFSMYKDGISKNSPTPDESDNNAFAGRLQTEISLLSHTTQGWQSSMGGPPQVGLQPITETAQEHLLKFHQTLEDLNRPPPGWQEPTQVSLLQNPESSKKDSSQSLFKVYRNKMSSSQLPYMPMPGHF
jgi:hypothetical protein